MSALDLDITDEEKAGGFEAGEQGDETFLLSKLDEYPGVMPELDYMEAAVIPPEDGVPSLLDQDDEIENIEEEDLASENDENVESEESDEIPDYEEDIPDYEDEDEDEVEEQDLDSDTDVVDENVNAEELNINDEELKDLVNSELERSKKLKESRPPKEKEEFGYGEDDIEPVPEYFEEVDDSAPEIAISEIDLDKPSTINIKKIDIEDPVIEPDVPQQEEETKIKKKTPLFSTKRVLAFSGLIAILFISLIVIFFDDIVTQNKFNLSVIDKISEESVQDEPELDTTGNESLADIEESKIPEPIKLELFNEENKFDTEEIEDLDDSSKVEIVIPKEIIEVDENKKFDNDVVSNIKTEKAQVDKPKQRTKPKNKTEQKIKTDFKKGPSNEGTFTVQIISTPSYDDAQDWLQKLKSRGISNGSISEKLVRDKVWYRVRFGKFETYQDASNALSKAGFDGSWVDRIK